MIKVEEGKEIEGKEYDLNNEDDMRELQARTDMIYESEGDEMIYYQNGVQNNRRDAEKGAALISEITGGEEVGIIHNRTAGKNGMGVVNDLGEYASEGLYMKDVLNAREYERIAGNGENNLIILHSAGNKDAEKAMEVLALEKRDLGGKIEFMSVGSPVKKEELEEKASKVGAKVLGQYNTKRDPVANAMGWVVGTGGVAAIGAVIGIGTVTGTGPMAAYGGALVGGGIGGSIGGSMLLDSLKRNHSFESYIKNDVKGARSVLERRGQMDMNDRER